MSIAACVVGSTANTHNRLISIGVIGLIAGGIAIGVGVIRPYTMIAWPPSAVPMRA